MRREGFAPFGDVVVRYSASEMPTAKIETLQRDNCDAFARDEIDAHNAFRICNLLLNIALMKLAAIQDAA